MPAYPTGWEELYRLGSLFLQAYYQKAGFVEEKRARGVQEGFQERGLVMQETAAGREED